MALAPNEIIPVLGARSGQKGWDQATFAAEVNAVVSGGGGITIEDEGVALPTDATTLNFVGAGVTASGVGATKTITIPGGGGVFQAIGVDNIYGGTNALANITTGSTNFAGMVEALNSVTIESFNTALGGRAGRRVASNSNTAIGYQAVSGVAGPTLTGADNTGLGARAGEALQGTATFNTCLGSFAGSRINTGDFNTIVGGRSTSLGIPFNGDLNTTLGYEAGFVLAFTGSQNTLIGARAGRSVSTGSGMICLGHEAGPVANRSNQLFIDITQRDDPLIFGDFAGRSVGFNGVTRVNDGNLLRLQELETNGFNFTALKAPDNVATDRTWTLMSDAPVDGYLVKTDGSGILNLVDPSTVGSGLFTEDAQANIKGGTNAGAAWSTFANSNFVGGFQAYEIAGSPDFSVAVGYRAGRYCSGSQNIQIGAETGRGISTLNPLTGLDNVYVGHFSGRAAAGNSNRNTCVGADSGERNLAGADNNTFIGAETGGAGGLTAADNTALGYQAGDILAGGCARNTLIGKGAGRVFSNIAPDTDNVCLGHEAGPTAAGLSNRLFIDNTQRNDPLIEGDFSARTLNINGQLESDGGTVNPSFRVDNNATAGETRMLLWDVDNGTLERVSVGAADSGGAGFKVLRIPN